MALIYRNVLKPGLIGLGLILQSNYPVLLLGLPYHTGPGTYPGYGTHPGTPWVHPSCTDHAAPRCGTAACGAVAGVEWALGLYLEPFTEQHCGRDPIISPS